MPDVEVRAPPPCDDGCVLLAVLGVEQAIRRIITFDPSVSHLTVKDCTYRFYRDTRFSNDKSPYNNGGGMTKKERF